MSFMSKIKDFFYDEEEIEEVVPVVKKETRRRNAAPERKNKINIYDIENEKNKLNKKEKAEKENKEISERELFKAERTFNFPMDVDDEEDFQPVKRENVPEKRVSEPIKTETRTRRSNQNISSNYKSHSSEYAYSSLKMPQTKKEEKRFKPTPVISPIYGILDQNYKKEDIKDKSKSKELSFDKKEVDFDTIRKKAYKTLDDELEKTISDKQKDIFYHLDDSKEEKIDEKIKEEKKLEEEYVEEPYKKDEVVITYNDDDPVSEEKNVEEELEVPKITRSKKNKDVAEEVSQEDESQDLFKIIDNMYKDPAEEEEE